MVLSLAYRVNFLKSQARNNTLVRFHAISISKNYSSCSKSTRSNFLLEAYTSNVL